MHDRTIKFKKDSAAVRLAAVTAVIVALSFAWFAIRWQLGDMIGEFTSPSEANADIVAAAAISLAPGDARGYWLAGAVKRSSFAEGSLDSSVALFENAVRRSPNHYRWWTELGRTNEQVGRDLNAELAFRQAVELAPDYAIPRWQLGNFYLRHDRTQDAIEQLKVAAEHNSIYRSQVFAIAWNYFGQDPDRVEQFVSDRPDIRAALAVFYASQNRPKDAIRIWNMLSEEKKKESRTDAEGVAINLFKQRSFVGSAEFSRQAAIDPSVRPEAVTNGDFESPLIMTELPLFSWRIARTDSRIEISIDQSLRHGGRRSLRTTLRGYTGEQFANLAQVVAVSPGGRYRIGFWIRTENLRSGAMPLIEVVNAPELELLARSEAFPTGTNEWQNISFEVKVPDNTDGISIRTARELCSVECPITGIFWLDDIEMTRL